MNRPSSAPLAVAFLFAVAAACSGGDASAPTPVVAAGITVVAGDGQRAVVATPVPTPPRVRVAGPGGRPLAGASVTFAVASGGGSITGATATTGADGRASVGSWTLGTDDGPQTLTATSGGHSVVITVRSVGGPAAAIALLPDAITTHPLGALGSRAPAFRVRDPYGNPVPNAQVNFTLASNAEVVAPVAGYTDTNGVVRPGAVTLASTGPQTLVATVPDGPSASVALSGTAPGGCVRSPHRIGAFVQGSLTADDCARTVTWPNDEYALTLTQQTAFDVRLAGTTDVLTVLGGSAANDLVDQRLQGGNPALDVRYVLPAGTYTLQPTTFYSWGSAHDYTLRSTVAPARATACGTAVTIVPGVAIADTLAAGTSCPDPTTAGALLTRYRLVTPAGRSARVTLAARAFGVLLELRAPGRNAAGEPIDPLFYSNSGLLPPFSVTSMTLPTMYSNSTGYDVVVRSFTTITPEVGSGAYTLTVTLQ